jgi:hypothetical protein
VHYGGAEIKGVVISIACKPASDAPSTVETFHTVHQTRKFWLTELLRFSTVGHDLNYSLWNGTPPCLVCRSMSKDMANVGQASGGT